MRDDNARAIRIFLQPAFQFSDERIVESDRVFRPQPCVVRRFDEPKIIHAPLGKIHRIKVAFAEIRPHRPAEELHSANIGFIVKQESGVAPVSWTETGQT